MSELEPTRTYSNPTATEILRRMLDERGVEWWQKKRHTCWKVSKGQEVEMWRAWEAPDGSLTLKVDYIYGLTPEQAIAATVGSDKVEAVLRKLIARLGVAADFHFARKYVDCIVEEYAGKLATLGAGTCHEIEDEDTGFIVCSECGAVHDESYTAYYCWCCGRRIEQ